MKRSFILRSFLIAVACSGLAGCHSDGERAVRKSDPDDPTAWTGSEVSRDEPGSSQGRAKSSRLQGAWSSEAKDIENSLGVGR